MNQEIRNKLRNVVTQCRKLLEDDVCELLEGKYAIFAKKDHVTADPNAPMTHLTDEERSARTDILDHFAHIQARSFKPKDALDQLVREIAFTHLNRFCAYKMMEAREVYVGGQKFREAVSRGINSNGVKFYLADHPEDERLFNTGHQDVAYRHFLDWLGGLLSEEIGVLFSPNDPANRLYPRQTTLDEVLDLLNNGRIKPDETELREEWPKIWSQDETIGWVYQYFTPKELRDQARKESSAPRNAYELAFRNQFFTPRYVVEFLTDNTLGRLWYEMRKQDTKLKDQCGYMVRRPTEVFLNEGQQLPKETAEGQDDLSQEELLQLPVYILHRPKKDPRELKVLDPASGSGHFLLYGFDLLLTIYEEAYADADLGPLLQKDYPKLDDLRRDVPRLILAHNLYGVDIDLRASQIAALALWLRCQRAYQEMGLKKDRPKIARSNFVCAEPMPGEQQMLKEFVGQLEPKLLGQLVEVVFDKMKLAGEAGSLLKIEEDIRDAVAEARRQWVAGPREVQGHLFGASVVQQQRFDFSGITEAQFFERAEGKVVETLRNYAEKAQNGQQLQRRLFTEDAVRGFAFVDMCHKRFDVVLMNPPFGDSSKATKPTIENQYPRTKNDLYAAFVEQGINRLQSGGMLGAITSRTGFFLSSFQKWREEILLIDAPPTTFADLGYGVLDTAMVETAAYTLRKGNGQTVTDFFRLLKAADKEVRLQSAVEATNAGEFASDVFHVAPITFQQVPGTPFAYSVSVRILHLFKALPPFEGEGRSIRVGLQTGDDFRFVRCWWEVSPHRILDGANGANWRDDLLRFQQWCRQRTHEGKRWVCFAKGGEYSPYYADLHLVVDWERNGEEMTKFEGSVIRNSDYYFRSGLTWSDRTAKQFGPRPMASGVITSVKGSGGYSPSEATNWGMLGFMCSRLFLSLMDLIVGATATAKSYQVGTIGRVPTKGAICDNSAIQSLAKSCHQWLSTNDSSSETSHVYYAPALLQKSGGTLNERLAKWRTQTHETHLALNKAQQDIDEIASEIYGIAAEDRMALEQAFSVIPTQVEPESGQESSTEELIESRSEDVVADLISYAVGCVVGRWDIRCATGERTKPEAIDPFDPLPVCSPGMLHDAEGLPLVTASEDYPLSIDRDGILVDDPDHPDDIVRRIRGVLEVIWMERTDAIESEACSILGVKEMRDYVRKLGRGGFWDSHVSRYSKSRRKSPIYWLLQSSKRNYALWLYYHRLDRDMLFKAIVNYVEPKIRLETSRLEAFRSQKAAVGESGREAKRLAEGVERQEDLLSELQDFEDKLRRVADLHLEPDLNDGVVLNIAPLHELVPWKEAKGYWEELLEGKYEWSSIGKQLRQKGMVK